MAKQKLSLSKLNPTFSAVVPVPVAGEKPADVKFTFKARDKAAYEEFTKSLAGREDVEILMDIACGWDLDEPFGEESLQRMCEMYLGAARAVIDTYVRELFGARLGN